MTLQAPSLLDMPIYAPRRRPSLFRKFVNVLMDMQQRKADRVVAEYLLSRHGSLPDHLTIGRGRRDAHHKPDRFDAIGETTGKSGA
jgi:hypothetical protein